MLLAQGRERADRSGEQTRMVCWADFGGGLLCQFNAGVSHHLRQQRSTDMNLDELLEGDDAKAETWLSNQGLLHICDCGYTVYYVDEVNGAVQDVWGDERCDEIYQWACDLANRFGWLWIEKSDPEHDIYHCQHCAESEWSLLLDLEKIAASREGPSDPPRAEATNPEPVVVFIDESYTNQFPREPEGSLSLCAFIVPESELATVQQGVADIMRTAYRGSPPAELKYAQISRRPGLLERVGQGVADLIHQIPSSRILGIYVPRSGLFGERRRALRAVGHYTKEAPSPAELGAVESTAAVEAAVRGTVNHIAQTIAVCVGNYLGAHNLTARIIFDPRNRRADEPLAEALADILPRLPINAPLIPHQDAVVTLPPGAAVERLGDRATVEFTGTSQETPGLQIADFLAGDLRTFFDDMPELLTEATGDEPLVNKRMLFPQLFRSTAIRPSTVRKLRRKAKSAVPLYRDHFVNHLVSCYAINGQMRNIDLEHGMIYDIMD